MFFGLFVDLGLGLLVISSVSVPLLWGKSRGEFSFELEVRFLLFSSSHCGHDFFLSFSLKKKYLPERS